MRLWAVHPVVFYQRLCNEGEIHCDPALSAYLGDASCCQFHAAYDWIAGQMRKRIANSPDEIKYPLWAWHSLYGKHQKPDLRWTEFRNYNGDQVCLELEILDEDVLLSDEMAWHLVLNDAYYCPGDDSDAADEWFETLPEEERHRVKRKSWERVFNVNHADGPCQFIQATFWQLKLAQVVDVRTFRGRNRK